MKILPYIFGMLMLLGGCASRVEPPPADAVPVSVKGRLTLIRIEPEPAPAELLIYRCGELAAVIGNESFVTLVLPAGTNTLTFDWEDSPLQFEETVILEPELQPEKFISLVRRFELPEITKHTDSADVTMEETLGLLELPASVGTAVAAQLDPEFSYVDEEYQ